MFAILRPHFRQLYAVREWFVPPGCVLCFGAVTGARWDPADRCCLHLYVLRLRPQPLSNKPWAFLFPHAPLVPPVPSDVSDAGRSPADDQRCFPANTSLAQRSIWVAFLITLGWCLVGLVAALPLYMVNTPCIAQTAQAPEHHGQYATFQDMSIVRLLRYLANGDRTNGTLVGGQLQTRRAEPFQLARRAEANGPEVAANEGLEARLIVLTVLVLVVAVLPALWKLLKEFTRLASYRDRWENVHCGGIEMAWLSTNDAPGFRGWGEQRIKDYLVQHGLSITLSRAGSRPGERVAPHTKQETDRTAVENETVPEIDVQGLFTVMCVCSRSYDRY